MIDIPRLLCRVDGKIGKDASMYKQSCEFGIFHKKKYFYDIIMDDIELLTHKIETAHGKADRLSLHRLLKSCC